jgi:hypothetical protein
MNSKEQSLAVKFPEIANEWDYGNNKGLTPGDCSYGSKAKVYWVCPVCKHSYPMQICNRTGKDRNKGNQCTVCQGRLIIPKYNSLLAKLKELGIENEWDYNNNCVDPDTIPPHSNKKYLWICPKGHPSYPTTPNNKISNTGGNCPCCSHQKLSPEFSLASINPELSKEWHPTKNGSLTPNDIFANSNKSVWWLCQKEHEWSAKINNRSNGKGCRECSKGTHTSFPEQVIYYFIKQIFPDVVNGYKLDGKTEIDVYIPSLNVGIEYDGENYHKTLYKHTKDIEKNKIAIQNGIKLIRIREENCYPMKNEECKVVKIKHTSDNRNLELVLPNLLDELCSRKGIKNNVIVKIDDVRNIILAEIKKIPFEKSLAGYIRKIENNGGTIKAFWDHDTNHPLTSETVKPMSDIELSWICKNNSNHRWIAPIKSISKGYGCSRCAKNHKYTTEEWIEEAMSIHGDKFDYSDVVYINSKTEVKIICPKHGSLELKPSEHISGKGCKFCAGQALHPIDSLANIKPIIASEWDFEKNKLSGLSPKYVGKTHKDKFWWQCNNGKPHSYLAYIQQRLRGSKCAVCAGRQIIPETSLAHFFPDIAKEWDYEMNAPLTPLDVGKGYDKIIYWKCSNPNHPSYPSYVYNRTKKGTGCKRCYEERRHKKKL